MTDVVTLMERYGELLKAERTAATPMEKVNIQLQMLEVKMALSWSAGDFYRA